MRPQSCWRHPNAEQWGAEDRGVCPFSSSCLLYQPLALGQKRNQGPLMKPGAVGEEKEICGCTIGPLRSWGSLLCAGIIVDP